MKHNFPKNINVICNIKHNLKQGKEILHLAIDGECPLSPTSVQNIINIEYPYFIWDCEDLCKTNTFDWDNSIIVSFEEFKAFLQGKGKYIPFFKEELNLNSKYKAIVTKNNITVGCQEFSHDIVKQLYQLSQKALKS